MSTLPNLLLLVVLGFDASVKVDDTSPPQTNGAVASAEATAPSFPLDDEVRLITPWVDDWAANVRTGPEIVGGQRLERTPAGVVKLAGVVMLGAAGLVWMGSGGMTRKPGNGSNERPE